MDRKAILEEIQRELRRGIKDKGQVVNVLTRIYILLEGNPDKKKHQQIYFFRNWVVHAQLDHERSTDIIKEVIDASIVDVNSHQNARNLINRGSDFFKLKLLHAEIHEVLSKCDLGDLIQGQWSSFLRLLLETVKHVPVIFSKDSAIQRIELLKNDEDSYSYKFTVAGSKKKPIVKLKLK